MKIDKCEIACIRKAMQEIERRGELLELQVEAVGLLVELLELKNKQDELSKLQVEALQLMVEILDLKIIEDQRDIGY